MSGQLKFFLFVSFLSIFGALILSIRIKRSFRSDLTPIDSFERKGIPIEIMGSKYPSIRVKLLDDRIGEFNVGLGHKLICESDTLTIRIFINGRGERIYGKIIEN